MCRSLAIGRGLEQVTRGKNMTEMRRYADEEIQETLRGLQMVQEAPGFSSDNKLSIRVKVAFTAYFQSSQQRNTCLPKPHYKPLSSPNKLFGPSSNIDHA
jgi:hypothetical protein